MKHYALHALTATTVFCCGVAADLGVLHLQHSRPKNVLWTNGQLESNYVMRVQAFFPGFKAELGLSEDGTAIWRRQ